MTVTQAKSKRSPPAKKNAASRRVPARPASLAPSTAQTPCLYPGMTPLLALQAVVLESLRHLHANVPGALNSDDVEFVHQARVALRRLRSAQMAFAEIAPAADWKKITAEIRWLATRLGNVRDFDVFLCETLPSIEVASAPECNFEPLKTFVIKRRRRCRRKLDSALSSARYARLRLRILQWLDDVAPRHAPAHAELSGFARHALHGRWIEVDALARHWHSLDEERRHDLRKRAKKLRYAVEFFSSLYKDKGVKSYLEKLQALQQILGEMNDDVAAQLLMKKVVRQDPSLERAGDMVTEWVRGASKLSEGNLDKVINELERAKTFW